MKQLLFLLLFPCLAMAQYPGNAGQKITLGEQTTADGLVYRGVANDTNVITPFSDTSAYIILDTVNSKFYHYNRTTTYWALAGGGVSVSSFSGGSTGLTPSDATTGAVTLGGTLAVANGGTGTGTLTANKVMVGNGTSGVLTPTNLHWDNTSNYFGIGTNNPVSILDVVGDIPSGGGGGGLRFVPTVANDGTTQYGITIAGAGTGASQFIAIGVRNGAAATKSSAMWVEATQPGLNIGYDYADVAPNNGAIINGEVRIGYTADQGAYALQINGTPQSVNALVTTSDEKFKENITPLNKGLEIVNKLKPVTFNFISDTKNNFSVNEEVGFIAQDVDRALSTETFAKSIVNSADDSEPTSTMGLAIQNLIPILVKAIQEQNALIKALEKRLLILENK